MKNDIKVEECCGSCRYMQYEDTDGLGICEQTNTPVYCGDTDCQLYEVENN